MGRQKGKAPRRRRWGFSASGAGRSLRRRRPGDSFRVCNPTERNASKTKRANPKIQSLFSGWKGPAPSRPKERKADVLRTPGPRRASDKRSRYGMEWTSVREHNMARAALEPGRDTPGELRHGGCLRQASEASCCSLSPDRNCGDTLVVRARGRHLVCWHPIRQGCELFFSFSNQLISGEAIVWVWCRSRLVARDEARNNPEISRGVVVADFRQHRRAVFCPVLADSGHKLLTEQVPRTRGPPRTAVIAR